MLLWIIGGVAALWALAAILGVGRRTVLKNPASMSDGQLEITIRLTGRIMDNSQVFSPSYYEAAEKHSAAMRELERRRCQAIEPIL